MGDVSTDMNALDPSLLQRRFALRHSMYLPERFEISPRATEDFAIADHLHICHAASDAPVLPLLRDSLLRAYSYVKDWFGWPTDVPVALWVAPHPTDLQYMTCLPCPDDSFFAPGIRNDARVVLFVSPLACARNADRGRLTGCLAHELTHCLVREVSEATAFTMTRRQENDVPMWLEEGLCELVQHELHPLVTGGQASDGARVDARPDLRELWNDLSSCADVKAAYRQAYEVTFGIVERHGKSRIIELLREHRAHGVDWLALAEGGSADPQRDAD